ncbi:MAG: ATP-binding protein [Polynucleobacter sp.]|nr:ATP-binding protein [Polynucleobacter sp.]
MMIFNSLRFRIAIASLVGIAIALVFASSVIGTLFEEHATRQFQSALQSRFLQVASLAGQDPKTGELIFKAPANEPRWSSPLSGLYWQANLPDGKIIRSRSLWDTTLQVHSPDKAAFYGINTSQGQHLMARSQAIELDGLIPIPFLLTVAEDTAELNQSIRQFQSQIQWYLTILAAALLSMVVLQITIGLSPLRKLKKAMLRLRKGDAACIEGQYPNEFSPLVDDFNSVLEQNKQLVSKAQIQAGNLAHAIKTPLAVITNAIASKTIHDADFRQLVLEQTRLAKEQVDWSLARAKTITRSRNITLKTPVVGAIQSMVRVMEKIYADKSLTMTIHASESAVQFNGDEHDLHEILGNVIDNACKWASTQVLISISKEKGWVTIAIEDDGPGIAPDDYANVVRRGVRLDEFTPGTGLGLAIVDELISIYGGKMQMNQSSLGGLKVAVQLPRSD